MSKIEVMLNVLSTDTVITVTTEPNKTVFTVPVGIHPADAKRLLNLLSDELHFNCPYTKGVINTMNQNIEYLEGTLNVKF